MNQISCFKTGSDGSLSPSLADFVSKAGAESYSELHYCTSLCDFVPILLMAFSRITSHIACVFTDGFVIYLIFLVSYYTVLVIILCSICILYMYVLHSCMNRCKHNKQCYFWKFHWPPTGLYSIQFSYSRI